MPIKPAHICNHVGCYTATRERYCEVHRKINSNQANRQYNEKRPGTDRQYWTARWQKLRALKKRLDPLCEHCLSSGRRTIMTCVDHIQPVKDGGAMWDLNNLQSLCDPCHERKTTADLSTRSEMGG